MISCSSIIADALTVDCSSYDGEIFVTVGAQYDSALFSVNLDDNTVVKLAEYGGYQGRISVSCVNKQVTITALSTRVGSGMISVIK